MCLHDHRSQEDLGTRLKQSSMCNFLSVLALDILPMVLKQPCHNQKKNTCKELSQKEASSLNIGTQYWTGLNGIALKNNKLNVAMADIRHWGFVLTCILYTPWQRDIFVDIFAPVNDDDISTRFLCAWLYTANTFIYMKVCALAKCHLFQPGYDRWTKIFWSAS